MESDQMTGDIKWSLDYPPDLRVWGLVLAPNWLPAPGCCIAQWEPRREAWACRDAGRNPQVFLIEHHQIDGWCLIWHPRHGITGHGSKVL